MINNYEGNNNNNGNNNITINKKIVEGIKLPVIWFYAVFIYFYYLIFQMFNPGQIEDSKTRFSQIIKSNKQSLLSIRNYHNDNNISYSSLGFTPRKTMIVIISTENNDSTPLTIFEKVKYLFFQNSIHLIIEKSENKNDTYRISNKIQQTECDGIICVGDDDLLHQIVNYLLNRSDSSILRHIPIGIIPAGKRNGFANSIGITSPEMAVKLIIHGNISYIDIMSISPIKNLSNFSFSKSNNSSNSNSLTSSPTLSPSLNIGINIHNNNSGKDSIPFVNSNNNNNLNQQYNGYFNNIDQYSTPSYKIYSILYIGWGIISERDKIRPWNRNLKPIISSIYSKFSKISLLNNLSSTLYFSPSTHFQDNSIFNGSVHCNKSKDCQGCQFDQNSESLPLDHYHGKKSFNDLTDWKSIEGYSKQSLVTNNNNNNNNNGSDGETTTTTTTSHSSTGMTFFLAGNGSHLSKDFIPFPFSHVSDGYIDLLISNQTDKKKLNHLIYDVSPPKDCLSTPDSQLMNSTQYYCKTKEFIFHLKNQDIPLTVDGELLDINREFNSNSIKIESHKSLVAIFI